MYPIYLLEVILNKNYIFTVKIYKLVYIVRNKITHLRDISI